MLEAAGATRGPGPVEHTAGRARTHNRLMRLIMFPPNDPGSGAVPRGTIVGGAESIQRAVGVIFEVNPYIGVS